MQFREYKLFIKDIFKNILSHINLREVHVNLIDIN